MTQDRGTSPEVQNTYPELEELPKTTGGEFADIERLIPGEDGDTFYGVIADGTGTLKAYDVSGGGTPTFLSSVSVPFSSHGERHSVDVQNGVLALPIWPADGTGTAVYFIDVSDPADMSVLGTIQMGAFGENGAEGAEFFDNGDRFVTTNRAQTSTRVYDTSDPTNPTFINYGSYGGKPSDVCHQIYRLPGVTDQGNRVFIQVSDGNMTHYHYDEEASEGSILNFAWAGTSTIGVQTLDGFVDENGIVNLITTTEGTDSVLWERWEAGNRTENSGGGEDLMRPVGCRELPYDANVGTFGFHQNEGYVAFQMYPGIAVARANPPGVGDMAVGRHDYSGQNIQGAMIANGYLYACQWTSNEIWTYKINPR